MPSVVRAPSPQAFAVLLFGAAFAWGVTACSSSSGGNPSTGGDSGSGHPSGSGSGSESSSGSGSGSSSGSSSGSGSGGTASGADSGPASTDAGSGPEASSGMDGGAGLAGGEGGVRDIGSCCSQQTTPGCDDPNVELCVCQMDSNCCTQAWALGCALLVQQKYCQPGVRDCVCGTDAGEWAQTTCCTSDWNSTCDSVATLKCKAAQGCF